MLSKLTPGVYFSHNIYVANMCKDPKGARNTVKLSIYFALLESGLVKRGS